MSNKTKWVDFHFVKSSVGFPQLLEHYQISDAFRPQSGGRSLRGPCPIHKGTSRDGFSIELEKNVWICHSKTACSSGGNILDFVARMENVTLRQAALLLVEWFNLPDAPGQPERSDTPSQPTKSRKPDTSTNSKLSAGLSEQPLEAIPTANKPLGFHLSNLDYKHPYLYQKGLTDDTILEFGLGYCSRGMMGGRIAVPIHNADSEIVAYAGRLVEESEGAPKWKLPTGYFKSLDVFNLHCAFNNPPEMPLIVVEGFFDAIKLHQQGQRKVVALMGTHMSDTQEKLIAAHLKLDDNVLIMFDDDDAGRDGSREVAGRLALYALVTIRKLAFAKYS